MTIFNHFKNDEISYFLEKMILAAIKSSTLVFQGLKNDPESQNYRS